MTLTVKEWRIIFGLRDEIAQICIGKPLKPNQKRFSDKILVSVFENRGLTLMSQQARQSGKTSCVAATIAFLLLFYFQITKKYDIATSPGFNVGLFAPLQQQADAPFTLLREYLKKLETRGFSFKFESFNGDTIVMQIAQHPTMRVYCMTASPTSHQESKTLNLIILDESQDLIDKVVTKAILPMGAMTNATVVWIGVAGYKKCMFYHHFEQLPPKQKIIVPVNVVIAEHQKMFEQTNDKMYLNYKTYVDKTIAEIGVESDEYKTQYALQWILERGQFITYENLLSLEEEYETQSEYGKYEETYGGIDWGKASDSTVFTIIDKNCHVIEWYEWQGDDYASQIEEIAHIVQTRFGGMKVIHCDSTGNQDMAVDILRRKLQQNNILVTPVNFNPSSKDEMYKNLWRLMHDTVLGGHIVESAAFKFPAKDTLQKAKFIKQMLDLQKEIRNEKWRCNHPDGPQYRDDFCDAAALACLAFTPKKQKQAYKPAVYI